MKNRNKFRLLAIFAALIMVVASMAIVGCKSDKDPLNGFLPGAQTEFDYDANINLAELIDTSYGDSYTLTAAKGEAEENLSDKVMWKPSAPGAWTLTYTVTVGKNSQTFTLDIKVKFPKMIYETSSTPTVYKNGDTVSFAKILENYDFTLLGYYAGKDVTYTFRTINIGGVDTEVPAGENYTFTGKGTQTFTVVMSYAGEYEEEFAVPVAIQYTDAAATAWANSNNMKLYRHTDFSVASEGVYSVTLDSALSTTRNVYTPTDAPYLAMVGAAQSGKFISLDFTGNNMPHVAFFDKHTGDEIADGAAKNLADGSDGLLLANGFFDAEGAPNPTATSSRITLFGAKKLKNTDPDQFDRLKSSGEALSAPANAGSISGLKDGVNYRLYIGFTNGTVKATGSENGAATNGTVKLHYRLINLDKSSVLSDYIWDIQAGTGNTNPDKSLYSFGENYFTGNVIIYGRLGYTTTFTIREGAVSDTEIANLDKPATFEMDPFPVYIEKGQISVDDYADMTADGAKFSYKKDTDDAYTDITTTGRNITVETGIYDFEYTKNGTTRSAKKKLLVVENKSAYDKKVLIYDNPNFLDETVVLEVQAYTKLEFVDAPAGSGVTGTVLKQTFTGYRGNLQFGVAEKDLRFVKAIEFDVYFETWRAKKTQNNIANRLTVDLNYGLSDAYQAVFDNVLFESDEAANAAGADTEINLTSPVKKTFRIEAPEGGFTITALQNVHMLTYIGVANPREVVSYVLDTRYIGLDNGCYAFFSPAPDNDAFDANTSLDSLKPYIEFYSVSDGAIQKITDFTVSGSLGGDAGKKTLTVTATDDSSKTAEFSLYTVALGAKTWEELEGRTNPSIFDWGNNKFEFNFESTKQAMYVRFCVGVKRYAQDGVFGLEANPSTTWMRLYFDKSLIEAAETAGYTELVFDIMTLSESTSHIRIIPGTLTKGADGIATANTDLGDYGNSKNYKNITGFNKNAPQTVVINIAEWKTIGGGTVFPDIQILFNDNVAANDRIVITNIYGRTTQE